MCTAWECVCVWTQNHCSWLLNFFVVLQGIFPQDEYPEEVSTDEDDDMFGSRKRMKRAAYMKEEEEEEGVPAAKKRKGNTCWQI